MSYGQTKKDNGYAREVLDIDATKTVWMALAFSLAARLDGDGGEGWEQRAAAICFAEWQALYDAGIVPQKPKREKGQTP